MLDSARAPDRTAPRSLRHRTVKAALLGALVLGTSALTTRTNAAPTVVTQQSRVLDGVAGATWGPLLLKASGGSPPYTWSLVSGTLPSGLTVSSTGRVEGKLGASSVGVYDFTVQVRDAVNATASRAYRVRVHAVTNVQTPPLDATELPTGYIQSAFFLGGSGCPSLAPCGCGAPSGSCAFYDPATCDYGDKERHKAFLRANLTRFNGGEVFFLSLESAADFQKVRTYTQAVDEIRQETGKEFVGYYLNGRLPDFFFPADLNAQPSTYRAKSLKSNGTLWTRRPETPAVLQTVFGLHGHHVDVANDTAVAALLARLEAVFDHEGSTTTSVGPLKGFYVFGESNLSSFYSPFTATSSDPDAPDNNDLAPETTPATRPTCAQGWNGRNADPPLLSGNVDPCALFADGDPRFSWVIGPKRAVPLFSTLARDKFVAYAAARSPAVIVSKLPADAAEFNAGLAASALPSHVEFVPLSNTAVWNAWTDWVYETWHSYVDRIARTITFAQAGNPRFRGVLYFQWPGAYSFRSPAKDEVIPYTYYDATAGTPGDLGTLRTVTNERLTDKVCAGTTKCYDWYSHVGFATDLETLMKSPWIQGFVHETTTPMLGVGTGTASRAADRAVLTSAPGVYLWNHEAAAAKLVARRNNKFFGMFARYFYFGADQQLSATDWGWNWDRTIPLQNPEVMSTLPGGFYLASTDLAPAYRNWACGWNGLNGPGWTTAMTNLNAAHTYPATWNPASVGFIDGFDGTTAFGWAYDPWSTATEVRVSVVSSPGGCYKGPALVGTVAASGISAPARDTAIRDSIKTSSNYVPPEGMGFEYGVDLKQFLSARGVACQVGTYQVQLVVQDKQGDGRTRTMPWAGSNNLSVSLTTAARVIWEQPAANAGFGPPGSLVIAGSAVGAPAGTTVQMWWRDATANPNGAFTADPYTPLPDAGGIWLHAIANANYSHRYEVYVTYGGVTSATCAYTPNSSITWCP